MALKDIYNKVKKEIDVVKGEETKDKIYSNENTFPDEATAKREFERSKEKLFHVNRWTDLDGINSTFELFDNVGRKTTAHKPEIGYFMRIILPASGIENWVHITGLQENENMAEFVVHPSEDPSNNKDTSDKEIKHFFIEEASSTFKVERQGNKIIASEIGRNEGINNQGEEAGNRAILNTLIAEGGWAGIQALQWDKLTSYLVHIEEAESKNA